MIKLKHTPLNSLPLFDQHQSIRYLNNFHANKIVKKGMGAHNTETEFLLHYQSTLLGGN